MKKIVIFFLLALFSFSSVSAVSLQFTKNTTAFDQGETLIAVVSGNFLDQPTSDKIFFYQDYTRIPMDFSVAKTNDDFYIYASLTDKPAGTYSMRISGVEYMAALETLDDLLFLNFTITDQTADFSVSPGFVKASAEFSLNLKNLKSNSLTVSVDSPLASSVESISLAESESKIISFNPDTTLNESAGRITLSSANTTYSIPLLIEKSSAGSQVQGTAFRVEPGKVNVSLATNSSTDRIIYLLNYGSTDAKSIIFSIPSTLQPYITISPGTINTLGKGDAEKITLTIMSHAAEADVQGKISVANGDFENSFDVFLNFVPGYTPPAAGTGSNAESAGSNTGILTTCAQLNGALCSGEEVCSGDTIQTSDKEGICCLSLGTCELQESSGSTGKIIGWIIVLIAIALLAWFFKKYKKVRPSVDILKIGQGKK